MIATCQFIGRTGNQLWQIAATINYALVHRLKYGFPNRSINESLWPLQFKNLPRAKDGYPKVWTQPDDGAYHEIPIYRNGVTLKGFFQSYKYINHPDTIPLLKKAIGYVDQEPKKGIAIHVRRGDYLIHKDAFPPLSMRYYAIAMLEITGAYFFGADGINVFSDDIEWCRANFPKSCNFHEPTNPVDDLFEISRYEHQIIANSSYSYWAAMLNPNPNKIVCCPHHTQYYGIKNRHLDTSTLYPESWKQIRF
jgi:hypothetical protein